MRQKVQSRVRRAEKTETRARRFQIQQRFVDELRESRYELRYIEFRQKQHKPGDSDEFSKLRGLQSTPSDRPSGPQSGSTVEALRHRARDGLLSLEDGREIQDAEGAGDRCLFESKRGGVRSRKVSRLRVPAGAQDDRQARLDRRAATENYS